MTYYIGDDWLFKTALQDESGNPIDITGDAIEFDLLQDLSTMKSLIQKDFTITDAVNGKAEVTITSELTSELCNGLNYICFTRIVSGSKSVIYQNRIDVKIPARTP